MALNNKSGGGPWGVGDLAGGAKRKSKRKSSEKNEIAHLWSNWIYWHKSFKTL